MFPNTLEVALPIVNSDHSPSSLNLSLPSQVVWHLNVKSFGEELEQCKEIITNSWNGGMRVDSEWRMVCSKLKICKSNLVRWSRHTFKNSAKEIAKMKTQLQYLLNLPHNQTNWEEIRDLRHRIDQLWKQEEIYCSQRSRVKWLKCGDKNSKFFHASTLQRRSRNRLHRI